MKSFGSNIPSLLSSGIPPCRWISRWTLKGKIGNNWKWFITPVNSTPGKVYGLLKTHKANNPVAVITSGCNTAIENLPIYIENVLYDLSEGMPSRIKDSNCLLDIIDDIVCF